MALITYLTTIVFDHGAIATIGQQASSLGMKRPLIVTDKGVIGAALLEKLTGPLGMESAVFDGTPSNPTETAILEAYALYQKEGCDGVIGLGGGSSIDLAKGVRLLSGNPAPLAQYAAIEGGMSKISPKVCPMIAVPTTAGTGSEVGRASVINMTDGRKLGVISPAMMPSIALCDPELTLGLPPFLTAATGMDAISHCLETYMAPSINPPAEAIALDGLTRGISAIRTAVKNGSDRQARWDMMMASTEGAMAFQKGLGAIHSLTHPLGAIKELNLHHGTLNAILTPPVLRFNRPVIGAKWDVMSRILGGEPDEVMAELIKDIGIPSGLDALGVTAEHRAQVAKAALLDHCHATNPRLATEEDYLAILEDAR